MRLQLARPQPAAPPALLPASRPLLSARAALAVAANKAMKIAADACIYTNHNFTVETISTNEEAEKASAAAQKGTTEL